MNSGISCLDLPFVAERRRPALCTRPHQASDDATPCCAPSLGSRRDARWGCVPNWPTGVPYFPLPHPSDASSLGAMDVNSGGGQKKWYCRLPICRCPPPLRPRRTATTSCLGRQTTAASRFRAEEAVARHPIGAARAQVAPCCAPTHPAALGPV